MTTLRHLLTTATDDGPPTTDLLEGVRRHEQRRRLTRRVLVPALSLATAGGLAATAVAVFSDTQNGTTIDAQRIVLAAAVRTSQQTFRVEVTGGQKGSWKGAFDPARRVGWFTVPDGGGQVRYIGDLEYLQVVPGSWKTPPKLPAHIHWISFRRITADSNIPLAIKLLKNGAQDPQAELAALREATTVQRSGPASGPGWTGVHYTFTLAPAKGLAATGSVDVDTQGRVRTLSLRVTLQRAKADVSDMHFTDFGSPVNVVAPPSDQVIAADQVTPPGK